MLNGNNWNTFRIQIEHHTLCSENSARLFPKGQHWRERFLVFGMKWLTRVDSGFVNNVLIYLPNQCAWCHMNMPKRFCRRQAKLALTSFLSGHFRYFARPRQTPSPYLIYTKLVQILRMLLERPHKNSTTGRLTLNGPFFVCVHHASSKLLHTGNIDLSRVLNNSIKLFLVKKQQKSWPVRKTLKVAFALPCAFFLQSKPDFSAKITYDFHLLQMNCIYW